MNYCRLPLIRIPALLAVVLFAAPILQAQPDSTTYLVVDCMKATSPDYLKVEQEIWKPIHQDLVDQGRKLSWALFRVEFGSREECDFYTVNRYLGQAALDNPYDGVNEVFQKVHPQKDFGEAMKRTDTSRRRVSTQLWAVIGGVGPKDFRYVHVNRMNAENGGAFVRHEMDVFRPVHQALVADGITKGWVIQSLVRPTGSSIGYNFATVDFVDSLGEIPFGDYLMKVHPDSNLTKIWEETGATRDLVYGETWRLVERTRSPE